MQRHGKKVSLLNTSDIPSTKKLKIHRSQYFLTKFIEEIFQGAGKNTPEITHTYLL